MKYILYCRKSTDTEDKQVLSLESQERELIGVAKREGLEIVSTLRESRSAKEPGRPIFNQMLKDISKGKADAILCWKVDRLTRNPVDGGQIQWLLQNGNIKNIRTFDRNYSPSDNVLLMSIEQAMATQYVRDLSELVKRGNREKLARGEWPNHAPFGYLNDKATKSIKIDKKLSPYVVRAFNLYATGGYTLQQIVEVLYEEGLRTRTGGKVFKNQIHRFFINKFYCGLMERDGVVYPGKHKAIVSVSLFNTCDDILHARKHPRPKRNFYSARGYLRCESCGCAITADTQRGHQYYYCTNGKQGCDQKKKYIRSEAIDTLLSKMFLELKFDEELISICGEAYKTRYQTKTDYVASARENLNKELASLSEAESRLTDGFGSGLIRKELFQEKMQEIANKRVELQKQIDEIESKNGVAAVTFEQIQNVFIEGSRAAEKYLLVDDVEKREMLQKLLSNMTIENGNMAQIQFKSPYNLLALTPKNADFETLLAVSSSNRIESSPA
ncbi:MAG: recombinase family protein [Candidatus Paceibacterota bacterium]